MANEDTTQVEFYAPWPNLGKKFSQQLGEIRTDTAHLAPLVRGMGLDSDGDFSSLDGVEKAVIQSREWGKHQFHNKFRIHYDKTNDLFDIAYNTGTEITPNWYTTWTIDKDGHVSQQNTPTTASNLGSGAGWFKQKSGVDLEFKSITATSPITITTGANSIDVDGSTLVTDYSSLGGDKSLITSKSATILPFKGLSAGPNVVLTSSGTDIQIESTAQVVEFYGIVVQHTDGSAIFPGTHILKVDPAAFYLVAPTSGRSAEVILGFRGETLASSSFVAVIGDNMTGPLLQADGTVSAPSFAFTNDPDTGLFLNADGDLAIVAAGASRLRVLDTAILPTVPIQMTSANSASTPDYAFFANIDTGIYQLGSNDDSIAFTSGGFAAGAIVNNSNVPVMQMPDGAESTPQFSFSAETGTGMYRKTTNQLGFATGGTLAGHFDGSQDFIFANHAISTAGGTSGAPAFSVNSSENTGIYDFGSNTLGFTAGGIQGMKLLTGGTLIVVGTITSKNASASFPTYNFGSDSRIGTFRKSEGIMAFASKHTTDAQGVEAGFIDREQVWTFTNELQAGSGTEAAPSYSFSTESTMGMYFKQSQRLGFSVNSTLGMELRTPGLFVVGRLEAGGFIRTPSWGSFGSTVRAEAFYLGLHNAGVSVDLSGNLVLDAGSNDVIIPQNLHVTKTLQAAKGDFATDMNAPLGVFYSSVDIGSDGPGDSIIEFLDQGTLKYTVGHDTSRQALILTSGTLDDTNDEIVITPDCVTIDKLKGGDIEFGTATFYTSMIADKFLARRNGSVSEAAFGWEADPDLGMYRKAENQLGFTTQGTLAGHFDANQNLHVTGDVRPSRVEAGIGRFYTSLYAKELEVEVEVISAGVRWTTRDSKLNRNWDSIVYGDGLFVTVASVSNSVLTSPDGINWTTGTPAADVTWKGVTYGNGLFVAVASGATGNGAMTSPDGINWTSRTPSVDNNWRSVTYGDGLFVAVSNNGTGNRVMTSPDGITWTTRTSSDDFTWKAVTYGNRLFVAVSQSGTGSRVMTSPDGITWTTRTTPANNTWNGVTYGNGLFVAVSSTGTGNRIMTSPDGTTWTSRTNPLDNNWFDVVYAEGFFVAIAASGSDTRAMTSPDGIKWTIRTTSKNRSFVALAYGNGVFAATSQGGFNSGIITSGKSKYNDIPIVHVDQGDRDIRGTLTVSQDLVLEPDEITATSAGVAASVQTSTTEVTTNDDNDLDNVTLANGASGQIKHIYCVVSFAGDTWKITPATMLGGSIITFGDNSVGTGCTLVYADSEGWTVVGNNGGTIS